ncbi:MAG: pitrilysin family protein, partial [Candidatus Gottesmanbacteria bacterium]
VMVGVGSRYETPQINGISHLLEHMVFKGTKKYPTTDDVNFIERLGGLQNAYTDIDVTCFHNKVLGEDWQAGLEINKELALYPRLEERHVEKERDVILEEMKKYEDEPAAKVGETFHTMLYPNTKLGMRIIGEEKALRDSTATTLRTYHDAWYQPERMVVVLAGKIDAQMIERGKDVAASWFGSLPATKTGIMETVPDGQQTPRTAFVTKKDAKQAHITLGLRIFNRSSEDRFSWNVFNLLFGVSFTSRLFKEIREKKGLCYTIRSSPDTFDDVGYWSIYAGVATEKVSEATAGIMRELQKVRKEGVTTDEVTIAIKRLKTMLAFRAEDPEFATEWYGRQELYHLPILSLSEYVARIETVTKDEIDALVRKYIIPETLNLAVVWNRPEDKSLVELLTV